MNIYFILVIQVFIAGGTHIVAKAVVETIDPVSLTFVRSLVSTAGLLAIFLVKEKRLKIEKKDWRHMILLGFLGLPINQFFYLYGIQLSTAANGALLYAATPVCVLVLSRLWLKERITRRKAVGIGMAFTGITIVIFERGIDFSSSFAFGNLVIFLAVIAWALFTVLGKPMILKYGAFHTTSVAMIVGMLLFAPFGALYSTQFPFADLSIVQWSGILYLGIGTSIVGYFLWYYALGKIEASKAAVFANGQPIIATGLAVIFLDYTITGGFLLGAAITISGVVITQRG